MAVGEGEGQTSEIVGFREALQDVCNKHVQGLPSTGEIARWIGEGTSKVDAAITTRGTWLDMRIVLESGEIWAKEKHTESLFFRVGF